MQEENVNKKPSSAAGNEAAELLGSQSNTYFPRILPYFTLKMNMLREPAYSKGKLHFTEISLSLNVAYSKVDNVLKHELDTSSVSFYSLHFSFHGLLGNFWRRERLRVKRKGTHVGGER